MKNRCPFVQAFSDKAVHLKLLGHQMKKKIWKRRIAKVVVSVPANSRKYACPVTKRSFEID